MNIQKNQKRNHHQDEGEKHLLKWTAMRWLQMSLICCSNKWQARAIPICLAMLSLTHQLPRIPVHSRRSAPIPYGKEVFSRRVRAVPLHQTRHDMCVIALQPVSARSIEWITCSFHSSTSITPLHTLSRADWSLNDCIRLPWRTEASLAVLPATMLLAQQVLSETLTLR